TRQFERYFDITLLRCLISASQKQKYFHAHLLEIHTISRANYTKNDMTLQETPMICMRNPATRSLAPFISTFLTFSCAPVILRFLIVAPLSLAILSCAFRSRISTAKESAFKIAVTLQDTRTVPWNMNTALNIFNVSTSIIIGDITLWWRFSKKKR